MNERHVDLREGIIGFEWRGLLGGSDRFLLLRLSLLLLSPSSQSLARMDEDEPIVPEEETGYRSSLSSKRARRSLSPIVSLRIGIDREEDDNEEEEEVKGLGRRGDNGLITLISPPLLSSLPPSPPLSLPPYR